MRIISILFLLILSFQSLILGSLPSDTLVWVGQKEFKKVSELKKGDEVYLGEDVFDFTKLSELDSESDLKNSRIEKTKIKEIKKIRRNKSYLLSTEIGEIYVGKNQKFYNCKDDVWIQVEDLKKNDLIFLNQDFTEVKIADLVEVDSEFEQYFYEIDLEYPHVFFIKDLSDNLVLVHNNSAYSMIEYAAPALGPLAPVVMLGVIGSTFIYDWFKSHKRKKEIDKNLQSEQEFDDSKDDKSVVTQNIPIPPIDPEGVIEKDEDNGRGVDKEGVGESINNGKEQGKRKPNSDLDNVLKGAEKEPDTRGKSEVYGKPGGKEQREKDFDKLNDGDVHIIEKKEGTLKIGKTKNGETLINRDFSSERSKNKPTLEIQCGKYDYIKIRYNS